MNIFVLDNDPVTAAKMVCDKHAVKMPTETAQMLSTVARSYGYGDNFYRPSYVKHPCTVWVGSCKDAFAWTVEHGLGLCSTYTARYGRRHAAQDVIESARQVVGNLVEKPMPAFAQAMPDNYKNKDAVVAYRSYYIHEKARFAKWRHPVAVPAWWPV